MTRFHLLSPMLAALATFACLIPTHAQDYAVTVTDLNPSAAVHGSYADGVSGGVQAGFLTDSSNNETAELWRGSAQSAVSLNPAGFDTSGIFGVSGDTQVGGGHRNATSLYIQRALLWHGTADSVVDLHPSGFDQTSAFDVSGNTQVGKGIGQATGRRTHALLWHGTAASVIDLNPDGFLFSIAEGVSGDTQVGSADESDGSDDEDGYIRHAMLWHGTPESALDLNPTGFDLSEAYGVSNDVQVGDGYGPAQAYHALLWHGTAAGVIDLNPDGFDSSSASGVSGDTQVGAGHRSSDALYTAHALLWRSTAKSALDLSPFLPTAYQSYSLASSVDDHDGVASVAGRAVSDSGLTHAFLWRVIFAPTLAKISPTTRTAGAGAFTLAATGMRFTRQSFLRWNGKPLATTFRNSELLRATVPASYIAQSGTARVTVSTPGVDTSRGQTLTIH